MSVLTLLDDTPLTQRVLTAARTVADLLNAELTAAHAGHSSPRLTQLTNAAAINFQILDGEPIRALHRAAEVADVQVVVLGVRQHRHDPRPAGHVADALLTDVNKPLLLVGPYCRQERLESFGRLLVPLDGSERATDAVRGAVDLFGRSGVDIVALHVFDRQTVPAFFDQPQHDYPEFVRRFRERHSLHTSARLALASGDVGSEVLSTIEAEAADLIALGCSRHIAPGRTHVLRRLIAESPVPVLVLRMSRNHGGVPTSPQLVRGR